MSESIANLIFSLTGYSGILLPVLFLALGLFLAVKCGDVFVDAAVWIAEVSGIPKFIIGATVVSLATTLPEILVSSIAAASGNDDGIAIATGNAVGSVTANTGLILAISIIFLPSFIERRQYAFKSIVLVLATSLLWLFSFGGKYPDNYLSFIGSALLLLVFVFFIIENVKQAKNSLGDETIEKRQADKKDYFVNILKFLIGIGGIVFGADAMVYGAESLAIAAKVPATVISATIIAIGTSLPELITTLTAIRKKETALSISNIIGANVIDIAIILPVCSFIAGKPLPVFPQNLILDMPVCLFLILLAIVPMLITKKFTRIQGFIILAFYIAYIIAITAFLNPILSIFK